MPVLEVLDPGEALPLERLRDERGRLAGGGRGGVQRLRELGDVVSVDHDRVEPECLEARVVYVQLGREVSAH